MSAIFFWGSAALIMFCLGTILYAIVTLVKDWKHYDSVTRWNAIALALRGIAGVGFIAIFSFIVLFVSWLFYQPGWGDIRIGLIIGVGIVVVVFILKNQKNARVALQEEKVIEQLRESGYEPSIYVYSMSEASIPYILNFAEKGIAFLELTANCSNYSSHSFIDIKDINDISLKKGTLLYTLTILLANGDKHQFNISSKTVGVSWQTANVLKVQELLSDASYLVQR